MPSWLEPLSTPEEALWKAFPHGKIVDLRVGEPDADDVTGAGAWPRGRRIRAEVICALLLGAVPAASGRLAAVRLRGAEIEGAVDLSGCDVAYPLSITESRVQTVSLDHASCRSVSLRGSRFDAISMTYARLTGLLDLRDSATNDQAPTPVSIDLSSTEVTGAVAVSRARIHGEVRCIAAQITGMLRLTDAKIINEPGLTLDCRFMTTGNQFYAPRLRSQGLVELSDARIGASLYLNGARLENHSGDALHARHARIGGDISMQQGRDPFTVIGGISMPGARVEGSVRLAESFLSADRCALHAPGISVARSLHLTGATVEGSIVIPGAVIGEQMDFAGMQITSPGAYALSGQGLTVAREALFEPFTLADGTRRPFRSNTTVFLDGATIGGNLRMPGAQLSAQRGGPALDLSGTRIAQGLQLTDGLTADGELRLAAVSITGRMTLGAASSPNTLLTLSGATVGEASDSGAGAWPTQLNLDGFTYQNLAPYRPARERVRLLERQIDGYRPRPYEELAAYYRRLGHDDEARAVLLARQRTRTRSLPRWRRLPGYIADAITGYGYRPARALAWAAGLLISGSTYFSRVHPEPLDPTGQAVFNPATYTADQLIPLVHIGNSNEWQVHGAALVVSSALTILGWVLSIAIAAGATRAVSRN